MWRATASARCSPIPASNLRWDNSELACLVLAPFVAISSALTKRSLRVPLLHGTIKVVRDVFCDILETMAARLSGEQCDKPSHGHVIVNDERHAQAWSKPVAPSQSQSQSM
jgi:hypothetical protein